MAEELRSFASRFALGLLTLALGVGLSSCGGSASETPPPLEPHPANLHYSRSSTTLPAADLPAEGNVEVKPREGSARPRERSAPTDAPRTRPSPNEQLAPSTWGSEPEGKPGLK